MTAPGSGVCQDEQYFRCVWMLTLLILLILVSTLNRRNCDEKQVVGLRAKPTLVYGLWFIV